MRRGFEKVSRERFLKNFSEELYETLELPRRKTRGAAGYDFYLLEDVTLAPGEVKKIATGVKAKMSMDEVLLLVVRSSVGFRYNIRLVNQVGVVDADYYNNPDNEGEIFYKVQNEGESIREFKAGESLVQGMFLKYLTVDEDDGRDSGEGSEGGFAGGFVERRSEK